MSPAPPRPIAFACTIATSLALVGCATGSGYPSLARRSIETRGFPALEPAPASPVAPDPAVAARIAPLEQGSIDADLEFQSLLPNARKEADHAGAPGGEGWTTAQLSVSALGALRARGRADLPALDALQHELLGSGDPAKIAAAQVVAAAAARIGAREAAQSATLSALEARLGGE